MSGRRIFDGGKSLPGQILAPMPTEAELQSRRIMLLPQLDRLAHELAERAAECNIDSFCESRTFKETGTWKLAFDPTLPQDEANDVESSVKYLELRGLLERHPAFPDLVRVKESK